MRTLIDIDDDLYTRLFDNGIENHEMSNDDVSAMATAIRKGKTLPKGHGRLIDADAYINKHEECGWLDDIAVNEFNTITPTIIEADTESECEE